MTSSTHGKKEKRARQDIGGAGSLSEENGGRGTRNSVPVLFRGKLKKPRRGTQRKNLGTRDDPGSLGEETGKKTLCGSSREEKRSTQGGGIATRDKRTHRDFCGPFNGWLNVFEPGQQGDRQKGESGKRVKTLDVKARKGMGNWKRTPGSPLSKVRLSQTHRNAERDLSIPDPQEGKLREWPTSSGGN